MPENQRGPYRIRPHHISTLIQLETMSPKKLAENLKEDAIFSRKDTTQKTVNFDALIDDTFSDEEYDSAYGYDRVGETPEQAKTYEKKLKKTFKKFIDLQDGDPIKLVVDTKDEICESCIFQNHCSVKEDYGDEMALEVFEDAVKDLGLEHTLSYSEEIAVYSNATPQQVKSVSTTAETIRKVFKLFKNEDPEDPHFAIESAIGEKFYQRIEGES